MRTKRSWIRWLGCMLLTGTLSAGIARATPANGFSGTTVKGTFEEFDVRADSVPPGIGGRENDLWFAMQRTKGVSDLYVVNNVWAPGGSTGWHTHPGYSLIIVTAGAVTAYEGDDCTPHVYVAGSSATLIDANHVHMIRNEGPDEARAVAVQIVPAGATRRIDEPAPPNCAP